MQNRRKNERKKQRFSSIGTYVYRDRNILLNSLGFESYSDYLKSSLWKDIRDRVLVRDSKCYCCGIEDTLIVHHTSYDEDTLKGINLDKLVVLCNSCHRYIEFNGRGDKLSLPEANIKLYDLKNSISNTNSKILNIEQIRVSAKRDLNKARKKQYRKKLKKNNDSNYLLNDFPEGTRFKNFEAFKKYGRFEEIKDQLFKTSKECCACNSTENLTLFFQYFTKDQLFGKSNSYVKIICLRCLEKLNTIVDKKEMDKNEALKYLIIAKNPASKNLVPPDLWKIVFGVLPGTKTRLRHP